ncbi:hypothetical protein JTB14_015502 [Gonioctena quinquepunctata]|nr:hypothetical protein JTB14_015502 [Gonioctena quinquepunctata]
MSIRKASCEYKIPQTTSRDHVNNRRKNSTGISVVPKHVEKLFGQAYQKVGTVDKGIEGFQTAGIYPFQPTIFNDEDFAPANTLLKASVSVTTSNGTEAKKSIDEQENVATPSTSTALSRQLHNNTSPPKMTTLNSNHDDVFSLPKPQPIGDKKKKGVLEKTLRNFKFYSYEGGISIKRN